MVKRVCFPILGGVRGIGSWSLRRSVMPHVGFAAKSWALSLFCLGSRRVHEEDSLKFIVGCAN